MWRPYLHGVVRVLVVEHQGLLDELMVALQLVDVVLVVDDVVLILFQLVHLVLQGPCDLDGAPGNLLMQQEQGETQVSGSQHPSRLQVLRPQQLTSLDFLRSSGKEGSATEWS